MTVSSDFSGRFSRRTGWDRTASEVTAAVATSRVQRSALLDLSETNPTACGFHYDAEALLSPLTIKEGIRYAPQAEGLLSARQAIVKYYRGHAAEVRPEQIILTASTSEAYSHLFRLLCDPGDEVLVAHPGYPLFDYLADLSDVTARSFPLFYDHGWWIDTGELERSITPRTRAIVIVQPNNPTGHVTSRKEWKTLQEICLRHGLSVVVDEVFLNYPHNANETIPSFASGETPVLTFVLNGLSKVAALPQMKVGWIVVLGPQSERSEAIERLIIIADTFLSVSTPAQHALPAWFDGAKVLQDQIRSRIAVNLELLRHGGIASYSVQAGWMIMLRLPRLFAQETASLALLEHGVLTHPAHFYGLDDPACVVASLIVPSDTTREAVERMQSLLDLGRS